MLERQVARGGQKSYVDDDDDDDDDMFRNSIN